MFQFLAITQAGCRRSFPRHLLHRITTLAISAVVVLVAQVIYTQPVNADQASRPNIILILADDMGWKDLHVQGNDVLRSPQLDRFATQGTRFTDAYAAAPVCSPTRGALMTGWAPARLHITQHGADTERFWPEDRTIQPPSTRTSLPPGTKTVADYLVEQGYAAGFFGKWHLGKEESQWPTHHGFSINMGGCGYGGPPTYFDPYLIPTLPSRKPGEYLTDRLADEAIAWMNKQDQPMFVCLWTYNPHYPFEAPEELTRHFEGKVGPGLKNPIYGGQIEATDRAVGRVLAEIERLGIEKETLVIMTSDNGGWTGATDNRPLRKGKGYLYEGGLRVPLIIRWPGVTQAGTVNHTPVVSMDLTATILEAAGAKTPKDVPCDGVSLRGLLSGEELAREELYFHYPHWAFHKSNRPGSAIRQGDLKLIRWYDDDSLELYDLSNDLGETKDLAKVRPVVARKMNQRLSAWLKETGAGLPTRREE